MFKLLTVFVAALILAYLSEKNTKAITSSGGVYKVYKDWAYILLVTVLVLFAGLRTYYNDTGNYINGFNGAPGVLEWLGNAKNFNPLGNPLYYFFQSLVKSLTNNSQVLIFITSLFTQCCFIRFIKRYSTEFTFSIFIYFTLGTFTLTLAAIKQVTAMAVLTLAFPYLEKKKWVKYFVLVAIAMLIHTYALAFVVLPFFKNRPWKLFTYIFAFTMIVLLFNFQDVITAFLEQADEIGKNIADYEVFDDQGVNIFRLLVYAVPPLLSLLFQKWIFKDSKEINNVLVHMSIIGLAFMVLGTQSGANMFGRMANYFELGTICILPTMLKKTFDARSHRLVTIVASICFFGFFYYANAINMSFDREFYSMDLWQFLFN